MTLLFLLCLAMDPPADQVVNNGKEPVGGQHTLVFTEDLRFGADEDGDDYLWGSTLSDIAVDARGHMFIGDPNSNELREFDTDGKFVRLVAGAGQGPGELQAVKSLQFLADGRLVVFEQKTAFLPRFQLFDQNLKYVSTKRSENMGRMPLMVSLDPSGTFFAGSLIMMDMQANELVTTTGVGPFSTLAFNKEWSSSTTRADLARLADPAVFADMISDVISGFFAGSGLFTFNEKGEFFSAYSKNYEITHWNSGEMGAKVKVIKKEYKPQVNTEEHKKAVIDFLMGDFRASPMAAMINDAFMQRVDKRLKIPEAKDPIAGLLTTPEGYLLVVHDMNMVTGVQTVDIFDKAGLFKGTTSMDQWAFMSRMGEVRMVFKNGYAYTLETDGDDNNRIVRYKYALTKK